MIYILPDHLSGGALKTLGLEIQPVGTWEKLFMIYAKKKLVGFWEVCRPEIGRKALTRITDCESSATSLSPQGNPLP